MMGIIVEINNNDAVILTDDGLFSKVENKNYEIGQAIEIKKEHIRQKVSRWVTGAATMAAAVAFCTIGAYAYFTPTDYVSLDVNPSVEYSVNMFDRILDVNAVNDDGEEILTGLDLDHKNIEEAVKETLGKLIDEGYLADDPDGGVIITTSNGKIGKAKQLAAELKQEAQNYLDVQEGVTAEVEAEAVKLERVREAREMGVTPGKLNLVERLQDSTSSAINKEEWLTMPVKEINKAIKENRTHEKERDRNDDSSREKSIDGDWRTNDNSVTESGVFLNERDAWKEKNSRTDMQRYDKNNWNREENFDKKRNNRRDADHDNRGNDKWNFDNWGNDKWDFDNWGNDNKEKDEKSQ